MLPSTNTFLLLALLLNNMQLTFMYNFQTQTACTREILNSTGDIIIQDIRLDTMQDCTFLVSNYSVYYHKKFYLQKNFVYFNNSSLFTSIINSSNDSNKFYSESVIKILLVFKFIVIYLFNHLSKLLTVSQIKNYGFWNL